MVINYREQDVAGEVRKIAPDGVDVIVEVGGGANAGMDAQMIGPDGTVAVYADDGGGEITVPIRPMMGANARWQFVFVYNTPGGKGAGGGRRRRGRRGRDPGRRGGRPAAAPLPAGRAAEAQQAVRNGVGKVLITTSDG